jgi:hypothetical protein
MAENMPAIDGRSALVELLAIHPPYREDKLGLSTDNVFHAVELKLPIFELDCSAIACNGVRMFEPWQEKISFTNYQSGSVHDEVMYYYCRNCHQTMKTFVVRFYFGDQGVVERATKIGEFPPHGDRVPAALLDVLDDEKEFFERGHGAENAGLGIGAFAYYRRFVESHKDKMISAILKVATSQGAKADVICALEKASKSHSFEAAVDAVKDAIPDSLRYGGGHNPLKLIHSALSEGLHSDDDAQCLSLARDIRLLLSNLAKRTAFALQDTDELNKAVNRLLAKKTKASRNPP